MSAVHIVILAAGKGTRMKSALPKVLHKVAGQPMIDYVLRTAARLHPQSTTVVIGHQAGLLQSALGNRDSLNLVVQEPQLGTGHALLMTRSVLGGAAGTLVLLSGDAPLLSAETVRTLIGHHISRAAAATVVTAVVDDPRGYGRIVRSGERIARIVEDKDTTGDERMIREINSGIYAFDLTGLFEAVLAIGTRNAQTEYYLPDLITIFRGQGRGVETLTVRDPQEVLGINDRVQLGTMTRLVRQQKADALMNAGVTIEDPSMTYIDVDVTVGADTVIHPFVFLEGETAIGERSEIHSGSRIVNSRLGKGVHVLNHCVIVNSHVGDDARIGPFAHFRTGVDIREGARVGNFVELKKTVLGKSSKAMHLTYLGDAVIGEHVNIGAGTITCNYDGVNKNQTVIGDGAFIGSDSQLVAPVTVGEGAYVGSGATIRENVPADALAVSAGKQRNILDWVKAKRRRTKKEQTPT
ncbi:MAG TPA: bifunctional UDP-N-acetylglucosamine diphosphorylase/glucosamine-1-phosphate N-acetyltransferase GlmU [Vicinamibacterales bacterium]|nr:bifunctional UDP-N-acetylglucosamine diphosphorylase/glucosamine-1-phosphate N-acetyltransferase GlmU [Vicinamibacterales bacterium]